MASVEKEPLKGGFLTSVVRVGETVERGAGYWSPAVHSWLSHLVATEPGIAPRPLGLDAVEGTETLSYLEGTVPSGGASPPFLWTEETLEAIARLVRRFHDASRSFTPPPNARWQASATYPGGGEVICHNDLAPWNTLFVDDSPVAFLDWDFAAPGPRVWDVAFALWHFVPLYGDPDSDPFPLQQFEPRATRTRMFCDAYGFKDLGDVVHMVIERQVGTYAAMERGAKEGNAAYQRLWAMGAGDGIQRQVSYVRSHQTELERALG
jgi:hypothetical protein